MINIEVLREIYHSIRQNRVRTILSGFGISWGILILVVLLGSGKGLQDAVMNLFSVFAQKSIYVYGGTMSEKYENKKEGAAVQFDRAFLSPLRNRYPEIAAISPEASTTLLIQNGPKSGVFRTTGVYADYMRIKILQVKDGGRLFNRADMEQERNVAVIGENVAFTLFGNRDALHEYIHIAGLFYKVVGILKNEDIFSSAEINSVYVPFPNYQRNINGAPEFNAFCLYLTQESDSKAFEESLRNYIARQLHFSSGDKQALYIANFETQTSAFESLFKGLRIFIWAVGICFLISGMAGIGNIMFVTVRERTCEIGIRKALGATPKSILVLILTEAVIITTLAGLVGLVAGKGILLFIDWLLSIAKDHALMQHTSLDAGVAFMALLVLILAGVMAGAFPAAKASMITPIEAIQYENRG
jgi:putative ABC transport system permease protein